MIQSYPRLMVNIKEGGKTETKKPSDRISSWSEYLKTSQLEFDIKYNQDPSPAPVSVTDFEPFRTVGTGWYGRVMLVQDKRKKTFHALKIVEKGTIVRLGQVEHTFNEKRILQAVRFPFFIHLQYYFKDNTNLYFVMPFVVGGELFMYLRKEGRFSEKKAMFYASQIILALEYLHSMDVIYRDLKPENVLINNDGYLKVTDFGFSKRVTGRTFTMCGTPEYFAPEMILNQGYGRSVDWWALGVFIYEMAAGYSPFYTPNPSADHIFKRISHGIFTFPAYFSQELREVCKVLLETQTWKRLQGPQLKELSWFRSVLWVALLNKELIVPFQPYHQSESDCSNYETFDEQPIHVGPYDEYTDIFKEF